MQIISLKMARMSQESNQNNSPRLDNFPITTWDGMDVLVFPPVTLFFE